ncbi:uncharacterized protein LOC124277068 [Haliotis rubra]|uniref:uncharacterized protein LOC124277068 n=1 Tax=Haliotis rubra TaxID=36100 RepID=UPI001EE5A63E|nr:uncharacterized protein LOC124277068 [Haliotis rubra]
MAGSTRLVFGSTRLVFGSTRLVFGSTHLVFGSIRLVFGSTRLVVGSTRLVFGSIRLVFGSTRLAPGAMKYFHIEAVTSYHLVVTPWAETTAGIAIITVSVLLGVVLISVTVVVICYAYKRRKRPVSPQRPSHVSSYRRQDKKPSKAFDIGYLKKHPPPALMSLPPPTYTVKPLPMKTAEEGITSIDYTNKGGRGRVINRDFRSTAGDEATGRVYNYDTRTNQRRWMKTPEGKPVRVTHH